MTTAVKAQLGIAALMFAASPWVINAAPHEATMGLVYKIYFYHMPSAWMFMLGAIVAGVASARFLFSKRQASDATAVAAAELAVVFGLLALVTGPLWARKAWGVWWVWDARLTSSLMLFLIFVAYLLLRQFGGPGSEKLSAGLALFGMANVPFIYVSVNYWRTLHPKTSVVPTLPVAMGIPLWFCVTAFLLLFLALLSLRATLEKHRTRIDTLYLSHDEA
ncbi:MAG: cytochrome c biogenesis protein CcsA [Acidobacteria bacterium]|nr:cytochrome c biogenesis protein CcsA [Acidobacteriota bacterium]